MRVIPERALDWRPESWKGIPSKLLTIRQQICHLRDIEDEGYLVRFNRLLHENEPALDSIDTYALVESRRYDLTSVDTALAEFGHAREKPCICSTP